VLARREGKTIRSRVSRSGLVADAVAKAVEHRVSPSEAGHDAFLTQVVSPLQHYVSCPVHEGRVRGPMPCCGVVR